MTRIVILGGPKTGKTTLASQMAYRMPEIDPNDASVLAPIRHTDDLIPLGWSEASQHVADEWLTQPGPWIIEGVAVARALRKWRDQHPGERPPVDRVIRLTTPHVALSYQQRVMTSGEATVWGEVESWLRQHGVEVEHRGENHSDRHRVPHPARSA